LACSQSIAVHALTGVYAMTVIGDANLVITNEELIPDPAKSLGQTVKKQ
jgi:hypothetical protein